MKIVNRLFVLALIVIVAPHIFKYIQREFYPTLPQAEEEMADIVETGNAKNLRDRVRKGRPYDGSEGSFDKPKEAMDLARKAEIEVLKLRGQYPAPKSGSQVASEVKYDIIESHGEFEQTVDPENQVAKFTLNPKVAWQKTLPLKDFAGYTLNISASGSICAGRNIGCSGPEGKAFPAKYALKPDEFAYGEAMCLALLGRIDGKIFIVGKHYTLKVPQDVGDVYLELQSNLRMNFLWQDTGQFDITVKYYKEEN